VGIRKLFSFLEHNFNKKQLGKGKMAYPETANASVSSPNFVDPADNVAVEAKRLANEPITKGSDLYY